MLSLTALRRAGDVRCGEPHALPAGDFLFGRHELPVQQVGPSVSSWWVSSLVKLHQITIDIKVRWVKGSMSGRRGGKVQGKFLEGQSLNSGIQRSSELSVPLRQKPLGQGSRRNNLRGTLQVTKSLKVKMCSSSLRKGKMGATRHLRCWAVFAAMGGSGTW